MGRIGDRIWTMSMIHAHREIETWQKELFNMEEVMANLEEKNNISVRGEKKRTRVTMLIGELECQISETNCFCENL